MISRFIKTFIIIICSVIITVTAVIIFSSLIAKYLIEKYDEKYTGRKIRTDWVYVNLFTGYLHISNLKIYESNSLPDLTKSDSVFFSAKGLSAHFAMLKLLSKTIEITNITIDYPKGIIIQDHKDFNFNDLVKRFSSDKPGKSSSPVHLSILNIKITNGEFHYYEKVIPVNNYIRQVNFECSGIYWNSDTIRVYFSYLSGRGTGTARGNFTINFNNLDYRFTAIVHKFDLKFLEKYIREIVNYGNFDATLDAHINATGNFKDREILNAKGLLVINDFHFGKTPEDDYASFDKLLINIEDLNPKDHLYLFDSVLLTHPYFKYERYDYLDNLERMFGKKGSDISKVNSDPVRFNLVLKIAGYIKALVSNFFQSDYKINKMAIYNGVLKYNDYSISEKFSLEADPFNLIADSVSKNHKRVKMTLESGIRPYGNITVNLSINPKDSGDFDLQYHLQKLPASVFNPYLITYTSFPVDRGTIELEGKWKVRNGIISSNNHLLIIDPRIAKRSENQNTKRVPMNLIMFFIRERGNVIDYEIPITGNLMNPTFHLKDVLLDMLGNIFTKPATTPYRMKVKNSENEIEKSLALKWEMRQASLSPDQKKFVDKMTDYLTKNPEAKISVYPVIYVDKELEYIRYFEAKKKYFLSINGKNESSFSKEDSLKTDHMSVKDTSFVHYLNRHIDDSMLYTMQDKCGNFTGTAMINAKLVKLNNDRVKAFLSLFREKALENRVKIHPAENSVPYNGFSFFKIVYSGELPDSIISAYRQMNEFNNESPRKRFKKLREKIIKLLK